jgi:hypothetical protein
LLLFAMRIPRYPYRQPPFVPLFDEYFFYHPP